LGDSVLELISRRLEVGLLEKKYQGQLVSSQRTVATCRLPWHFEVRKRQAGQSAPAAPAGGTVAAQNEPGDPSGQRPLPSNTPTPPCVRTETRAPTQGPIILPSPASCPLPEEEHHTAPCVPYSNPQPPAARHLGASTPARPPPRKRGRDEANLDDTDPRNTTEERRVRPRREQQQRNDATSIEGPSAPPPNPSRSQPSTRTADTWTARRTTQCGVLSIETSSSPATSATPPASQPDAPNTEPALPLRTEQAQQSLSQPIESSSTVVRATNPRSGPVSGGVEIWLSGEDLPTTFALYARFGTRVTATVSPIFDLQS